MNVQLRSPGLPGTSRAAEGMERRRWSVAEIEALVASGVIDESERFELIGGEIVPMSPKGNQHELLKVALTRHWTKLLPDDLWLAPETTFRLSEDTFLEPDIVFYSAVTGLVNLNGENALLAVEVADTSLGYDLGRKARLYASFGLRELWVINALKRTVHVHRRPGHDGYAEKEVFTADQLVAPVFAPALAVKLSGLRIV